MGKWSEQEIPFLMDDVECGSASTNFLSCSSNGWGVENCGHSENVFLACFAGKASLTFLKYILVACKNKIIRRSRY